MIDQTTEGGKALQAVVKQELKQYLGQDYNDDVLPLYIVVMLAHGNQLPLVKDNLEAFLGQEKSATFAEWLFDHLNDNLEKYDPSAAKEAQVIEEEKQKETAPVTGNQDSGQKRPREKREKIEWKGEKTQDRSNLRSLENHDEKRRRSGDRIERHSRHEPDSLFRRERDGDRDRYRERDWEREREYDRGRDRDRERDWGRDRYRRRSPERWDDEPRGRYGERHERYLREDERLRSHRGNGRERGEHDDDRWGDRRDLRRYSPSPPREREVPVPSRLAGRLGKPSSPKPNQAKSESSTPPSSPRPVSKPSVFDRLKKPSGDIRKEDGRRQNGLDSAIRTRMRMDTLRTTKNLDANSDFSSPGPQAETISSDQDEDVDEEKDPNLTVQNQPFNAPNSVATPAAEQGEVASELRQIREQLAKLNAERAEKKNLEMATQIARKAVVQNVHFNATPDILKAHFSGCGNIVSAVIEKEATGRPKGVALIEFETEEARRIALTLSGSLLLGRPITVLAKEPAKRQPGPNSSFYPPNLAPNFRPRAPSFNRGRGRGPFPGRHTLKNNKYVRPSEQPVNGDSAKNV